MRGLAVKMARLLAGLLIYACIGGCSHIPITEKGLMIDKDTTAGVDGLGVGRVTKQF